METGDWTQYIDTDRLPQVLVVVVFAIVIAHWLSRFLNEVSESFTERRLLLKKVAVLSRWSIYLFVMVVAVTQLLVLEPAALLAAAGTLGIVLGFAFKDVLASVTSGFFLVVDAPFQVGDRIAFGGYYGEVQKIGLRSVQLVTLDDNLVTIPNSRFLAEPVASANAGELDCMVVIPFYIATDQDFDVARRIIHEATATSRYVYLEKPVVTLLAEEFMGERFVTVIRVKAYVFDARFEKPFASDVTERVKRAFRDVGIRTPDQQVRGDLVVPASTRG
jgi:small-conductance mechanosensitive channel